MSVIQTLREKYATVVVVVVCISLVAFLLMDAFVGPNSFMKQNTTVVSVNGSDYDYNEYMQDVKMAEDNFRGQNPGQKINDEVRSQIKEQVYNQFVQDQVLKGQYEKLGIAFPSEELRSLTVTQDADPQIKQIPAFQNPETGQFDPNRVINFIQSIKEAPATNQEALMQRQQWMQLEEGLKNTALIRKYNSLITKGLYLPSWLNEQKSIEENSSSDIKFVSYAYSSVPDSSVTVSDKELEEYLQEHKKMYEVEATRSIKYVAFDAVPSAKDSAKIFGDLETLRAAFDTVSNAELEGFITRNSETDFRNRYLPEGMIESDFKEDLIALKEGEVYGPYLEDGNVTYAKMVGAGKNVGSSYTIQQITISDQMDPDSIASARADSILNAIRDGALFGDLSDEYSHGQAPDGGTIEFGPDDPNIPDEFVQYVEDHKIGDLGIIKTDFGYHVIRINDKQGMETGYKIAYLTSPFEASQETDNALFSEANKFRGLHGTSEEFEKGAEEEGLPIQSANDFVGTATRINDLASSRDIVHWAFNAKLNEVSKVFVLPDAYVVAVLTGETKKGTAPLKSVRPQIEALVRRQKKGEKMAEMMKAASLQEIAQSISDSVKVSKDISFNQPFLPNAGYEPKVVGASFNKDWQDGKLSNAILGEDGVYMLTIDSLRIGTVDSLSLDDTRTRNEYQLQQMVGGRLRDVLIDNAEVKDNRLDFQGL